MRRSRYEIISDILEVCKKGASKTRIVYQVNLNFGTVNFYLDMLIKKDLLTACQATRKLYKTTPKGEDLLDNMNQLDNLLYYRCDLDELEDVQA